MDKLKLIGKLDGGQYDLTAVTGEYSKSDDIDALGECFTFSLVCNPLDPYMNKRLVIGAKVIFTQDDKTVFAGIVVKVDRDGLSKHKYTCYDYGFYLSRNKVFMQFNGYSTTNAVKRVCSTCNIPVGKICQMGTPVWGIYEGKVVSDAIKSLCAAHTAATGKKVRIEVRDGKLCIEPYTDMVVKAEWKPADNVASIDPTTVVGSLTMSESIEDMRNAVKVTSGDELHKYVVASAKDSGSIKKFGLMTEVMRIDDKDYFRAGTVVKNKLRELNRVAKEFKCELLGDNRVRAGRILVFSQPILGLSGNMLVKHCEHHWNGTAHTMSLELQEVL